MRPLIQKKWFIDTGDIMDDFDVLDRRGIFDEEGKWTFICIFLLYSLIDKY